MISLLVVLVVILQDLVWSTKSKLVDQVGEDGETSRG